MSTRACNYCQKPAEKVLQCERCLIAVYCSEACKKKHWKKGQHRLVCKKVTPFPPGTTLQDAQALAVEYPDTFEAPSRDELVNIHAGDYVKISIGTLKFWNTVLSVARTEKSPSEWHIFATTENTMPVPGVSQGSRVVFQGKNVLDIKTPKAMMERAGNMPAYGNFGIGLARSNRR